MRLKVITALFNEYKKSIKSPDTEEKLDLILYRPFGFMIAKVSHFLNMTPTMLSLFGLFFGLVASLYFLNIQNTNALAFGGIYFILSGIFDSADGQLARISNQSTSWGLILDGICDSLVTIAIYFACAKSLITTSSYFYLIIIFSALYFHSLQCAILDFYHREYLCFGLGKKESGAYWNPSVVEGVENIKNSKNFLEKILNKLRLTWIKKQQLLTTRTENERMIMREFLLNRSNNEKQFFMKKYREHNLKLLPWWRLIGVNAHTFLIIFFMYFNRFDIYLIAFDLILFNVIIFVVGGFQKKADKRLFKEMQLNLA